MRHNRIRWAAAVCGTVLVGVPVLAGCSSTASETDADGAPLAAAQQPAAQQPAAQQPANSTAVHLRLADRSNTSFRNSDLSSLEKALSQMWFENVRLERTASPDSKAGAYSVDAVTVRLTLHNDSDLRPLQFAPMAQAIDTTSGELPAQTEQGAPTATTVGKHETKDVAIHFDVPTESRVTVPLDG